LRVVDDHIYWLTATEIQTGLSRGPCAVRT